MTIPPPGPGPGARGGDQKEATEMSTETFGRRKNDISKCWNDLARLVARTVVGIQKPSFWAGFGARRGVEWPRSETEIYKGGPLHWEMSLREDSESLREREGRHSRRGWNDLLSCRDPTDFKEDTSC